MMTACGLPNHLSELNFLLLHKRSFSPFNSLRQFGALLAGLLIFVGFAKKPTNIFHGGVLPFSEALGSGGRHLDTDEYALLSLR